ncbi:MAG: substrate-binding domain-containing protein [Butyricicoccus sp.]|nr:substrate-binding domain-containing protein [Butyricicoccus sp.]
MRVRNLWKKALVVGIMALLCACAPVHREQAQPSYTIGVVLKAMNSQHWMEMRSGMEQAAAECDAQLLLLYPEQEEAVQEQDELIASVLDSGIDALLVAPCDSYHTAWFAEKAHDQGILTLTVDTQAGDSAIPYVGADNVGIGQRAADFLAERLDTGAKVGVIAGSRQQSTHIDRIAGFTDRLTQALPTAQTQVRYTDSQYAQGMEQAQILLRDEGCSALFCTNAVMGLAAAQVQDQLGTDAWIVAVDTQDDALYAVLDGAMDALITQSGYEIGYQAVSSAVQALQDGRSIKDVRIASELLTEENIASFMEAYHAEG